MKMRFTLVEILGVIAIISILAGIGFAGYSYAMNASKESATKAVLKQLELGLESARIKHGYIPTTPRGFTKLTVSLSSDGTKIESFAGATTSTKGWADFQKEFQKVVELERFKRNISGTDIVDGWGQTIYYCYPGTFNKSGFDLISAGSDGGFGTDKATDPAVTSDAYKDGADWICDDIANF